MFSILLSAIWQIEHLLLVAGPCFAEAPQQAGIRRIGGDGRRGAVHGARRTASLTSDEAVRARRAGREELPGPLARPPVRRGEVVPPVARRRVPRGRLRWLPEI